jgi:phosphopantothenoylcysteine decarboxylase/phosphopantothenate--cysteine ligase
MARILLGVSGGIAAYKALELVRLATKAGHAVRVVQTPTAQRFVGAASFAGVTGAPVLTDEFERDPARGAFPDQPAPAHDPLSHLELVRNADAFLIAPASANTIAKLAHGLADNLLTSAALAAACPVLVAPAMNNHMYEHGAVQANLATLAQRGVTVLEPGVGALGSKGEWGVGRLVEPGELLAAVEAVLPAGPGAAVGAGAPTLAPAAPLADPVARGARHLFGLRVLVTAGGTREPIDAVRYVGNRSSGRMGFALAEEAAALGADVTVVAANVSLEHHPRVRYVEVSTAAELAAACAVEFAACDVLLMAAAVADYRPATAAATKIKKDSSAELTIVLERTDDVLTTLAGDRRPSQTIVGFAAEHGAQALAHGREKLARKSVDAVVINDIARTDIGFEGSHNEVTIVTAAGERHVARTTKAEVARAVLQTVSDLRAEERTTAP